MSDICVLQTYFFCLTNKNENYEKNKFYSFLYSFALLNNRS